MFEGEKMKCLENLYRTQIPNDVIIDYLNLYKSIGNNHQIHEVLEPDYDAIVRQTIRKDTYFFLKIFKIKTSDTRFKSLIYKGVKPKNKEEALIQKIHSAFEKIHKENSNFELLATETQDLLTFLFGHILSPQKQQFRKMKSGNVKDKSGKTINTREIVERMVHLLNRSLEHQEYEVSFLIISFYIDFLHVKPFFEKNEEVALLLMYVLLLANGYEVYDYVSFFEIIYNDQGEFDDLVIQSGYNWEMGYAQILPLHKKILKISQESYEKLEYLVRDYQFDSKLNKSDNVENTIIKLDEVFSKDDIRNIHPYISDSTINRTLKRLRDEKKIRPLGKGRSAKWIKLEPNKNKKFTFQQLDLNI
jgi:hypothetical protein